MRRLPPLVPIAVLFFASLVSMSGQEVDDPLGWSVRALYSLGGPSLNQEYQETYSISLGGSVGIDATFPVVPFVVPTLDIRYDIVTISQSPLFSLWMLRPELGLSLRAPLLTWFEPYLFGCAGYSFAGVNQPLSATSGTQASGLSWGAGAGLEFKIGRFSIFAEFVYNQFVDLFGGIAMRLGGGWAFDPGLRLVPAYQLDQPELEQQPQPLQEPTMEQPGQVAARAEDVDISFIAFDMNPVFPILYKYYDANPIGSVVIANDTDVTLTDAEVRLTMQTYMDNPKLSASIEELGPGAERKVDLYALFNDQVLYMTEGDLVSATVSVEFKVDGVRGSDQETVTVEFYDRNALKWDDTRKVATFVTARDVELQRWAKQLAAMARRDANSEVSSSFQLGMMVYTAMVESELAYVVDPTSPHEQLSQDPHSIDYVQFPRQTLDFRAGDCDDLCVCYATLLEAAGVPTAFITIPGHIFLAFELGWDEAQARRRFSRVDSLIFRPNGSVWVPVEATLMEEDFITAWIAGSRAWRENDLKGQTEFVPTSEAWQEYLPVAFVDDTTFERPDDEAVSQAFRTEIARYVSTEIAQRESLLLSRIDESPENPRHINNLGALYARYGLYAKAEEEFIAAMALAEHAPTLVNLGNLALINENLIDAEGYYDRALRVDPTYPLALLGAARVSHELENFGTVRRLYDQLKLESPELALEFDYLETRGEQASRASDAAQTQSQVIWGDE